MENLPGDLIRAGILVKRGTLKNWSSRWFVLTTKDLSFFKTPRDRECLDSLPLASCSINLADVKLGKKNCLEVISTTQRGTAEFKKKFCMYAKDKDEMKEWMEAIQTVIFNQRQEAKNRVYSKVLTESVSMDIDESGELTKLEIALCPNKTVPIGCVVINPTTDLSALRLMIEEQIPTIPTNFIFKRGDDSEIVRRTELLMKATDFLPIIAILLNEDEEDGLDDMEEEVFKGAWGRQSVLVAARRQQVILHTTNFYKLNKLIENYKKEQNSQSQPVRKRTDKTDVLRRTLTRPDSSLLIEVTNSTPLAWKEINIALKDSIPELNIFLQLFNVERKWLEEEGKNVQWPQPRTYGPYPIYGLPHKKR